MGLIVGCVVSAAAGCEAKPKPAATLEQLAGRLAAAQQVNNPVERDRALGDVALDAAEAGVDEVTLKAIEPINNPVTRDKVAQDCASRLAKAGKTAAAVEAAKKINNPVTRDRVMKEIASGS
jgi:hypothetical protein